VTSFLNAKRWEISCQTQKKEKQDRTARKETGIRSASDYFYSTKAFAFNDLASKEQLEKHHETVTFVNRIY
jgi:hypothetical protein